MAPPCRNPIRKAVIVGCTYQGDQNYEETIEPLAGSTNDAYVFALALVNLFEFHPNEICLLTDAHPAEVYQRNKKILLDERGFPSQPQSIPRNWNDRKQSPFKPSKSNILLALNWLVEDAMDGDILVFYFAGYGIQLDNMAGWEGEGYSEAILPNDYRKQSPVSGSEINAILTTDIRDILLSTSKDVQISIFLDACGVEGLLDPCGTMKTWPNHHIKGAKVKGVWPFQNVTDKMLPAKYKAHILRDTVLFDRYARARYVAGEEVDSTKDLKDCFLQKINPNLKPKYQVFQFTAAEWGTMVLECVLPSIAIRGFDYKMSSVSKRNRCTVPQLPVIHGIFTYCLIYAMQNCMVKAIAKYKCKRISFQDLHIELNARLKN